MLVKLNPASIFNSFRNIVERDNLLGELFNTLPGPRFVEPATQYPKWDVMENDNEVVVYAYLPGYKKEDIKLNIVNDELMLTGKRDELEIPGKAEWLKNERTSGTFTRTLGLSEIIDQTKVSAKFEDGILEIHLLKKEEIKPKEIPIKIQ